MASKIAGYLSFCTLLLPAAAIAAPKSWILITDMWGNPAYQTLVIDVDRGAASGTLGGAPLTGTVTGNRIVFIVTREGEQERFSGVLTGQSISGTADLPGDDSASRQKHGFAARRIPDRPQPGPRDVSFAATSWSNRFDPHRLPVLTLWPGDTLHTSTVDSGGLDAEGRQRALPGNPQVGPFFIAGAEPGDTLVVHLRKLDLNRDFADSRDEIVGRAMSAGLAIKMADINRPVRWKLDKVRKLAIPPSAEGALAGYSIPVRSMLGGLAAAPGFNTPPVSTGDSGRFGGNMDFNEVVEGNTVYLPVQQPGALLYLGDGHALQGDGETTQWALETSLDVTLTVDLVKGRAIQMPLVESPTQIMAVGQAGSLDEAVRSATDGMVQWLQRDYALTLPQSAELLGVAARYSIVTLAGRNAGVAARIEKSALPKR